MASDHRQAEPQRHRRRGGTSSCGSPPCVPPRACTGRWVRGLVSVSAHNEDIAPAASFAVAHERSPLRARFTAGGGRMHCPACGLRFTVSLNGERKSSATLERLRGSVELHHLRSDPAFALIWRRRLVWSHAPRDEDWSFSDREARMAAGRSITSCDFGMEDPRSAAMGARPTKLRVRRRARMSCKCRVLVCLGRSRSSRRATALL